MKIKMIRLIAVLLLSITVLLCAAGCGKSELGEGNTVSIGYASGRYDMIISSSENINCDYLLVYNANAAHSEIDACIDFLESLSNTYSATATFQICPDTLKVPDPSQKLILLGNTAYVASAKAMSIMDNIRSNNYYDYMLRSDVNLLSVGWISKFGREDAFNYIRDVLFAGNVNKAFKEGYSYLYLSERSDSPVVTVDDVNIVQYSVVLPDAPSYIERNIAEQLVKTIKKATGTELPIVTDVIEDTTYEILIGDTNRAETYVTDFFSDKRYAVAQYGSKLILRGGRIESTATAVAQFNDMVNNSLITAEPLHLKSNYCKTGYTDNYTKNFFGGYSLKYSDEFNGTKLDDTVWTSEENQLPTYGVSPGIMCYSSKQVSLDGKNLVIRTELLDDYTSGEVNSFDKLRLKHGYVEVRAKFRTAPGFWIKLLLTNQYEKAQDVSQIDVFNSLASSDTIFGTVGVVSQKNYYEDIVKLNDSSYEGYRAGVLHNGQLLNDYEYHTYGVEWTEEYIRFFIDGVPYGTVETTDKKYEDLQKEMYLSFFVGVEMTEQFTDDSQACWPIDFMVDWIRIYQKPGDTISFGPAPKNDAGATK